MEVVARSAPDGYTLYICGIGQSIRPAMHKKLPFDTLRDFTRIWLYGAVPNVLVVHPSVPARSVVESGYPGFEVTVWYGLCGPARLPGTVIATLLAGIGKTLAAPDLRRRFAAQGVEPRPVGGSDFDAFFKNEVARWAKVVKDAGIAPE